MFKFLSSIHMNTYFGCRCSIFGKTVGGNEQLDAFSVAHSTGCTCFWCFKQFGPFVKVWSQNGHL